MKKALISVSDKTNIIPFVKGLRELGYSIISTGGTYKYLKDEGIPVVKVAEVTNFPEVLDGRVKTLHPKIHGGILANKNNPSHQKEVEEHDISYIDLVCVNLYPFKQTINKENLLYQEAIENIDIGGPAMLRSAAKNHENVIVVVDPNDYEFVLAELHTNHDIGFSIRQKLAAKTFSHTASYYAVIAKYLLTQTNEEFPQNLTLTFQLKQRLRYGENPHQLAALYESSEACHQSIVNAKKHHGKDLSYNNILDANAAIDILSEYSEPTVVAIKHTNPCGVGTASNIYEAWLKAYHADPVSIFGGIIALNRCVCEKLAKEMSNLFLEVFIAPQFSNEALEILKQKKNIRLLELNVANQQKRGKQVTSIMGGLLIQDYDALSGGYNLVFPTKRKPTAEELDDLTFAYKVVKHVKSNAIVIAKNKQTIGIGAGQMNRVGAAQLAINQAKDSQGAIMASDAFFPMGDTVQLAQKAGIKAIIQPGGSIRDQESIDICDEYGIAMVFTNVRHFKH